MMTEQRARQILAASRLYDAATVRAAIAFLANSGLRSQV